MIALAAEAEKSPPGANGLVILPYFSGERTPIHDPHAKGVLFGLNLTHTRGDIYRALLEGIACGTNHIVETYREVGAEAEDASRGRRRHQEQGLGAGDLRCFRAARRSICEKTIGASLRRRVSRGARRSAT